MASDTAYSAASPSRTPTEKLRCGWLLHESWIVARAQDGLAGFIAGLILLPAARGPV
jgi:hypothetical protein